MELLDLPHHLLVHVLGTLPADAIVLAGKSCGTVRALVKDEAETLAERRLSLSSPPTPLKPVLRGESAIESLYHVELGTRVGGLNPIRSARALSNRLGTAAPHVRLSFLAKEFSGMEGYFLFRCFVAPDESAPRTMGLCIFTPDGQWYGCATVSTNGTSKVQWYVGGYPVFLEVKRFSTYKGVTVNPLNGHSGVCKCNQCK